MTHANRALNLSRETVRDLSAEDLDRAAAGRDPQPTPPIYFTVAGVCNLSLCTLCH